MSTLYIGPDSPELVRAGAALVLLLHIGAGSIGLLSGAAALMLRKGSRLHGQAGRLFVVSMLTMSAIGAIVAPFLPVPERASVLAGMTTFYLVLTAWASVRRQTGSLGRLFDGGMLFASLGISAVAALLIWMVSQSASGTLDGQPRQAFYLFVIIGLIAVVGDVRLVLRRGVAGAERIARHLWRMCAALFIAAGSLFLGQQQVFPASLRGSAWFFVPELVILAALLFWLCRVLFGASYGRRRC
ncbi:hypothetical protein AAKU55_005649 [Oxalobacteraceae bacterium GrIS 1.11]